MLGSGFHPIWFPIVWLSMQRSSGILKQQVGVSTFWRPLKIRWLIFRKDTWRRQQEDENVEHRESGPRTRGCTAPPCLLITVSLRNSPSDWAVKFKWNRFDNFSSFLYWRVGSMEIIPSLRLMVKVKDLVWLQLQSYEENTVSALMGRDYRLYPYIYTTIVYRL